MFKFEKVLEELFIDLSNKVEIDPIFVENEKITNNLMELKGVEKRKLVEIDHAVYESLMRAMQIVCKEAFLCGINFYNKQVN